MKIQKIILKVFLLLLTNVVLCLFHLEAFRSNIPIIGFATAVLHIVGLILFPYKKVFFKN